MKIEKLANQSRRKLVDTQNERGVSRWAVGTSLGPEGDYVCVSIWDDKGSFELSIRADEAEAFLDRLAVATRLVQVPHVRAEGIGIPVKE